MAWHRFLFHATSEREGKRRRVAALQRSLRHWHRRGECDQLLGSVFHGRSVTAVDAADQPDRAAESDAGGRSGKDGRKEALPGIDWRGFAASCTLGGLAKKRGGNQLPAADYAKPRSVPRRQQGPVAARKPKTTRVIRPSDTSKLQASDERNAVAQVNASRQSRTPSIQCLSVRAPWWTIASTFPTAPWEPGPELLDRLEPQRGPQTQPLQDRRTGFVNCARLPATSCRPVQSSIPGVPPRLPRIDAGKGGVSNATSLPMHVRTDESVVKAMAASAGRS